MKALLLAALMMLAAATALPMQGAIASPTTIDVPNTYDAPTAAYDDDDIDDEWKCSCTATCDGNSYKASERVCADDEEINEAVREAADACARELDGRCEEEAHCKCSCKLTGRDC